VTLNLDCNLVPGLLAPAFVACSTASDKCWGKKAWIQGYIFHADEILPFPSGHELIAIEDSISQQ